MLDLKNKTKELRLYKNTIMYNSNHKKDYRIKKYMEIEFFSNKIIKLDLDSGADITNCDYIEIKDKGKLVKSLFKSNLMN